MRPSYVTLEMMLDARERRAAIQYDMLQTLQPSSSDGMSTGCLVCLTLNIAGEIKRTPMTRMLFDRGIAAFNALGLTVLQEHQIDEATGSEAFWLVRDDAKEVKAQLEKVEESLPAARLFDFDVLIPGGEKLSRATPRRCLVCDAPAAECARSRAHGLDAIKAATNKLLKEFCADTLAQAAYGALLDELYTTPKPGLVDKANNGAHKDMDIPLFEKSAASLLPYFRKAILLGMEGCDMAALRKCGAAGEQAMFEATGGVNTHKGMVYSMGLLLAGMGHTLTAADTEAGDNSEEDPNMDPVAAAIQYASALASQDAEARLKASEEAPSTNGGKVLAAYGAKGATGEAMAGFPHAVFCAEHLRWYRDHNYDNAGALAFCDSMAALEDTNLLHRGGPDGLAFTQQMAAHIASMPIFQRAEALTEMDRIMILRNLSPGGSADMLALAFLLEHWRSLSAALELPLSDSTSNKGGTL